jgi:hypothetical protein
MTFYLASVVMDATPVVPMLAPMLQKGTVVWNTGSAPLRAVFYNIKRLDDV